MDGQEVEVVVAPCHHRPDTTVLLEIGASWCEEVRAHAHEVCERSLGEAAAVDVGGFGKLGSGCGWLWDPLGSAAMAQ